MALYEPAREQEVQLSNANITQLRTLFDELDVDETGEITEEGLTQVLQRYGKHLPSHAVRDMIAEVDQDDSGTVNWEEFLAIMKRVHALGGTFVGQFVREVTRVQRNRSASIALAAQSTPVYHFQDLPIFWKRFFTIWRLSPVAGTMPGLASLLRRKHWLLSLMDDCLRGLGQVAFMNNPVMGACVIAAALVNDVYLALMGLVGLLFGTLCGKFLDAPAALVHDGLFGYNGYLTGTAVALFQADFGGGKWNYTLLLPVIFWSSASTVIGLALGHVFGRIAAKPIAVYTLPFHLSTWLWLLGSQVYKNFPNALGQPGLVIPSSDSDRFTFDFEFEEYAKASLRGIGQVFFFESAYSGGLVLAGLLLTSWIAGLAAWTGSVLALMVALAVGAPYNEVVLGLWSYDAVLACICTAGLFLAPCWKIAFLTVFAGTYTTFVHGAVRNFLQPVGMPALTFAAALGCLSFTVLGNAINGVQVMDLSNITVAEQHIQYRQRKPKSNKVAPKHIAVTPV
eukprot:m.28358 g.28358  ORF g.28358 m.28358 type:complete len:510 (-) comp11835_c0_seq1:167-1696(-)